MDFLRHAARCAVPLLLGLEVALMGLQSLQYCAFLVVVAAVYLHLPVRMQPVFLLGASWVFYALEIGRAHV